jgi:hypothetical protein
MAVFCLLITVAIKIFPMFAVWEMTEEYEAAHPDVFVSESTEPILSDDKTSATAGSPDLSGRTEGGAP